MEIKKTIVGHLCTVMGWMFFSINPQMVPLILSSVASVFAIVNYYYSIKKNKKS